MKRNGQDPTARRRRSPDQALKDAQQIIKRHRRGEHLRPIAAALGLSKTTVERVIKDWRRAQAEAGRDVEQAALLAKLGGGGGARAGGDIITSNGFDGDEFDDDFDELADTPYDRLSREDQVRLEWKLNEAVLRADPTDPLALYRRGYLRRPRL